MTKGGGAQKSQKNDDVFYERPLMKMYHKPTYKEDGLISSFQLQYRHV